MTGVKRLMKKYIVEITETLQKQIELEAETGTDAIAIVKQMYRNGNIVLSAEDYVDTEIRLFTNSKYKDRGER